MPLIKQCIRGIVSLEVAYPLIPGFAWVKAYDFLEYLILLFETQELLREDARAVEEELDCFLEALVVPAE